MLVDGQSDEVGASRHGSATMDITTPFDRMNDLSRVQTEPRVASLASPLHSLLALPAAERRLGPFRLVEQLGRGGFAPVWLAREVYGGTELRRVAVKLFLLGATSDGDEPPSRRIAVRSSILDEARSLCRVEHPNVVRFYALPIDEALGVAGLAMEYVEGTSLDRRLKARGRLSVTETLAVGIAIASALSAVHRKGIVHRDVKPANVVEAAGDYKLIDFGIAAADARSPRRANPRLTLDDLALVPLGTRASFALDSAVAREREMNAPTASGILACGTLGYVDPACVALGAHADAASDLYALGAMLFECLAGYVPAAKQEGMGLLGKVLDGRAPAPSLLEAAPEAPPALARVVDALLRQDRRDRPESAEWVVMALEQIRGELSGLSRAVPPETIGPFRGLGRFRETDRGVYFGRSSEIAAALELLRGRGLLALVGPSGSGKSSLARAGVLPAVAEGAIGGWPKQWDVVAVEPGHDPRAEVSAALASIVPDAGAHEPEALISELIERARVAQRGVVLLIDQLEELSTLSAGPSRDWTVRLLGRLASQALPGVRAVVTVRRDLLDPLLALEGLGKALIRGSLLIEPISALTWAAVLDQALSAYGYSLEDEALREEIAAGIAQTDTAMPLLQFALTELWEKRDAASKTVTRAGLRAIGGLSGALERHAEATLSELSEEIAGAERAAKTVLLSLTTPQGTRATRRMEDLVVAAGDEANAVVDAFMQARLVVSDKEGLALAHEALLSQWGRLRSWVEEAREDRLLGEELARDAARWRADPRLAPLWRKHRLSFGEGLLKKRHAPLSEDAKAFLAAGRRAERRSRFAVIGALTAVLVGFAGVGAAYVRAVEVKEEATRRALVESKQSQGLAEQRAREVQEKQAKIDELLADMKDSPSKATVMDLQRQIREAGAGSEAATKEKKGGGGDMGRAPSAVVPAADAHSASAVPAPSVSAAPRPAFTLEKTW
jgi:serine/threonine protein kinase